MTCVSVCGSHTTHSGICSLEVVHERPFIRPKNSKCSSTVSLEGSKVNSHRVKGHTG